MDLRNRAIERGWVRGGEGLLLERLAYPLARDLDDCVHASNRVVRDRVLEEMLGGLATPVSVPCCLGNEEEIVVAEVERYGLPLRTVLSCESGLMRSDPYYDPGYLARFYREHYRALYRPRRFSLSWFIAEQIRHGQRILERLPRPLRRGARVLDVGCGMGGMLVAFAFEGCEVVGFDYGADYVARGRRLGLELRVGGFETVAGERPFDLIMMSHVLEHAANPIAFARGAAELLSDDGLCHIEVPGIFNIRKGYDGDTLTYLQNAHQWHFTAGTLTAVLARAGLQVESTDESICCFARRGPVDHHRTARDGQGVVAELTALERSLADRAELSKV